MHWSPATLVVSELPNHQHQSDHCDRPSDRPASSYKGKTPDRADARIAFWLTPPLATKPLFVWNSTICLPHEQTNCVAKLDTDLATFDSPLSKVLLVPEIQTFVRQKSNKGQYWKSTCVATEPTQWFWANTQSWGFSREKHLEKDPRGCSLCCEPWSLQSTDISTDSFAFATFIGSIIKSCWE